jgi:predicted metal-dependent hydrolase
MTFPPNYIIKKKHVKNASIRISAVKVIYITVPLRYSNKDITELINKKQRWINKTLQKLNAAKEKISIQSNQLLLFGKPYKYRYNAALKNRVAVNFDDKVIDSDYNLVNKKIQEEWYKLLATDYFTKRVNKYSREHNLDYNKITIRCQKTRWGSCSMDKNLSFNWKLMKAPQYVIDYIIVHELAHTKYLNHSKPYWKYIESIYPEFQSAETWLKNFGGHI